jgi:PIN domain nuclease of toxin-antitoxin system
LVALIRHTLPIEWARDVFDRLLVAHSAARRVALCTVDREIRQRHTYILEELGASD